MVKIDGGKEHIPCPDEAEIHILSLRSMAMINTLFLQQKQLLKLNTIMIPLLCPTMITSCCPDETIASHSGDIRQLQSLLRS